MGKDTYHGPLEQVDACCWRIPKSYKPGMRVDGLIFANEQLLEQLKKDQAPEQVANVAFLPGIQHASLAMPDIHWGYGFCIGGVCATDPDEGGVISPGGVGYDINCLTGESRILHAHGYTPPHRRDGRRRGGTRELACFDLDEARPDNDRRCRWFGQKPRAPVLRVVTEAGDEIRATADHPFWTPDGMVPLGRAAAGRPRGRRALPRACPTKRPPTTSSSPRRTSIADWPRSARATGGNASGQILDIPEAARPAAAALLLAGPARTCASSSASSSATATFTSSGGRRQGSRRASTARRRTWKTIRADLQAIGVTPSRVYSPATPARHPERLRRVSVRPHGGVVQGRSAPASPSCWPAWARRSARRPSRTTTLPPGWTRLRAGRSVCSWPACSGPN